MRSIFLGFLLASGFTVPVVAGQKCIDCHKKTSPGVVADWQLSRHAANGIDCEVCHGGEHKAAEDAAKAQIPTPDTCGACHEERLKQFTAGKHAKAWAAMKAMPTAHAQPVALMEGMKGCGGCHKIGFKTGSRGAASAWRPATPATQGTPSRSRRRASRKPVRRATWASTIRNGRCTPPPSTACVRS